MPRTCSQCTEESVLSHLQEPLCKEHAKQRLEELKEKRDKRKLEFEKTKQHYEDLKNKYNVRSYGHIEHQLNVEGRDDIDEDDVQAVNEAEVEFGAKREKFEGVQKQIERLEQKLQSN